MGGIKKRNVKGRLREMPNFDWSGKHLACQRAKDRLEGLMERLTPRNRGRGKQGCLPLQSCGSDLVVSSGIVNKK